MQSVRTPQLAFVITNPFTFYKDYDFTVEDVIVKQLGIESITDVKVFNILTLQEPFEESTVNLQAPIIINTKNNQAKQVILNNESYKTKHPLFIESPDSIKGWFDVNFGKKKGEAIQIGNEIEITIISIQGDQVKIGIEAPKTVEVYRKEIYEQIQEENKQAATTTTNILGLIKKSQK